MTDAEAPGDIPDEAGDEAGAEPAGDTTVRRPRIPARRAPAPPFEIDQTGDTIVVRRGGGRRAVAAASVPVMSSETDAGPAATLAYPSRVAAPVRGSRKVLGAGGAAPAGSVSSDVSLPDAAAIARAVRARARRRLFAVVLAIVALIVALLVLLGVLLFAVGV